MLARYQAAPISAVKLPRAGGAITSTLGRTAAQSIVERPFTGLYGGLGRDSSTPTKGTRHGTMDEAGALKPVRDCNNNHPAEPESRGKVRVVYTRSSSNGRKT